MMRKEKGEMLKSKGVSVTSTTGPLWVAAFFLKKLKKAQVLKTQIPFCVDKILHEEMDTVSYRVLAYLLLGVVRIYSKKVEYLLNDCDKVHIKTKKYTTDTNVRAPVETLCMSIAIPKRFELDALELDIPEDSSRDHIASQEEITLKDVVYETEEPIRFSDEKFDDFDYSGMSGPADHLLTEEYLSETFGISMLSGRENGTTLSLESLDESQQVRNKDNMTKETTLSYQIPQEVVDITPQSPTSSYQIPQEVFDITPQSRFQCGSTLIGRTKPGAAGTPESMPLSTPSARETADFSRKRKAVFDKMIVLPAEVLKKSIEDASDLIANRKKFRRTLLSMQRQSRISRLPNGFYESLLPCDSSSKLQSLFSTKTLKLPKSFEKVETQQKLYAQESQTAGSLGQNETARQISQVVCELQTIESPEHIATAPTTPPLCQNVTSRSMKHTERTEVLNSDDLGPSSPQESRESEQLLERNDIPIEEPDGISLNSYESLETEQCFTADGDLNLMKEDVNVSDAENSKLTGWSERTRKFATHLHKSFLDPRKQKEGDVVNFSQVSEGRTRKECARLFHELLVLKSTSYVNVQQSNPYGDIAIHKLPKLDQTFGVDT